MFLVLTGDKEILVWEKFEMTLEFEKMSVWGSQEAILD